MSVYVDSLVGWGWKMRGQYVKSCHMIADSLDELHAMAAAIGMKRAWFQGPPKSRMPHYDLTASRRAAAVAMGAIECSRREFVDHKRRVEGRPPIDARTPAQGGPTR